MASNGDLPKAASCFSFACLHQAFGAVLMGLVGYLVISLLTGFLSGLYGTDIGPTTNSRIGTVISTLIFMFWFAYDANTLCKKMSPDEYLQGMIFFYVRQSFPVHSLFGILSD